jgi:hypothetical protein
LVVVLPLQQPPLEGFWPDAMQQTLSTHWESGGLVLAPQQSASVVQTSPIAVQQTLARQSSLQQSALIWQLPPLAMQHTEAPMML